jgi:tetratricopeptide (TPR) repeat protein
MIDLIEKVSRNELNRRRGRAVLSMFALVMLSSCMSGTISETPERAPASPVGLEAEMTDKGVSLRWQGVAGATRYTVFWGTRRGAFRNLVNCTSTEVTLSNLPEGHAYYFAVTAWNAKGESDYADQQLVIYDRSPSHAERYLAKGVELMRRGHYDEAKVYLSAVIRLNPDNVQAYRARGQIFRETSLPKPAQADFQRARQVEQLHKLSASVNRQGRVERQ